MAMTAPQYGLAMGVRIFFLFTPRKFAFLELAFFGPDQNKKKLSFLIFCGSF